MNLELMKKVHHHYELTCLEFYSFKEIFWQTFNSVNLYFPTSINLLVKVEKYRFYIQIDTLLNILLENENLKSSFANNLHLGLLKNQMFYSIFENDQLLIACFVSNFLDEFVYRKKSPLDIEKFIENLQFNSM